ncbi:MAG: hypothetical protein WCG10_02785 [Chlamydiota bacterium]
MIPMFIRAVFFISLAFVNLYSAERYSGLEDIIAPEIKNDAFYQVIYEIARNEKIETVLEIGSSSGEGSTEAFAKGIQRNLNRPKLFCMEISKNRFAKLSKHYAKMAQVICYNVSSVPANSLASLEDVSFFYNTKSTNLNGYPLEDVLAWLRQDLDYISSSGVYENGIALIKHDQGIDNFDVVLIDGSEFSGQAELQLVYGAKFILLDDINSFKNFHNHEILLKDPNYFMVCENRSLRNGYSVFKKKD